MVFLTDAARLMMVVTDVRYGTYFPINLYLCASGTVLVRVGDTVASATSLHHHATRVFN